ncbi:MAG TPA: MBL fold metallo-hydrolase [Ktedonobacterales bacterium]|nr:MBL fold metallo-hydrolase [Ktedonobacterales bacterium]
MTRLFFLGTAAALPTGDRGNSALALVGAPSEPGLLIDCGDGVYRALVRAEIGPDAIGDLFITHAHIDHLGGLPSLIESLRLAGRRRPLRVFALPETMEIARQLLDAFAFELTLDNWPFAVSLTTVDEASALSFLGVSAQLRRMRHSIPSAGLRLVLSSGALAYTCDTEPNPAIPELGRQTRLLITECTTLHKNVLEARKAKHMTALEAGQQATECGAEALALVHLGVAEGWSAAAASAEAAQAFSGPIITPQDGDVLEL